MNSKLKATLLQILLGAIGSAVTAVISNLTNSSMVETSVATAAAGPATTLAVGFIKNATSGVV